MKIPMWWWPSRRWRPPRRPQRQVRASAGRVVAVAALGVALAATGWAVAGAFAPSPPIGGGPACLNGTEGFQPSVIKGIPICGHP